MAKYQTRLASLDEKIARPLRRRHVGADTSARLAELYDTEIGRDTISRVTDALLEDIAVWRSGPLDRVYPIVYALSGCNARGQPRSRPQGLRSDNDALRR